MGLLILAIALYHRKYPIPIGVVFGMALVGILHILAGNIYISGTRIYDIWIIKNIIKMDNIVHLIGGYVSVFISYTLLIQHLDKETVIKNKLILCLILILMASGIGALNEIFEFFAVIFFDAAQNVGNYYNNALDLLVNLFGAVIACFYVITRHIKK